MFCTSLPHSSKVTQGMEQQLLVLLCKWRFRPKVSKMVKSWQLDQNWLKLRCFINHPSNFFSQEELLFFPTTLWLSAYPNFHFDWRGWREWVMKCLSLNKLWSSCHDSTILDILVLPLSWHKNRLPKSSNLQLQAEQAKRQAKRRQAQGQRHFHHHSWASPWEWEARLHAWGGSWGVASLPALY